MSCPFNQESLAQLKAFVDVCKSNPDILHLPDLKFFKNFIEALGGVIPPLPKKEMPTETEVPDPETQTEAEIESEPESDLELDNEGCIEPDEVDPNQILAEPDKEVGEEELDKAEEKRGEAQSAFAEGNWQKTVEMYTEAIKINPTSALMFAKRGQVFLKLNKPNACIKDCSQALVLNPDSAAAYKFRGRAYRLIAEWEKAAADLRTAAKIDLDEQTDEWLKEVTPNATKIEQHNLKIERKRLDKEEKERLERIKRAKEAHAKAAQEPAGGAGGPSGPTGAGMGDYFKVLQDPDVMSALRDPEVAAAFQDICTNPGNFIKYQSNPKIRTLMEKLTKKFDGPGMPPFGAPPNFGADPTSGGAAGVDDDGLD